MGFQVFDDSLGYNMFAKLVTDHSEGHREVVCGLMLVPLLEVIGEEEELHRYVRQRYCFYRQCY